MKAKERKQEALPASETEKEKQVSGEDVERRSGCIFGKIFKIAITAIVIAFVVVAILLFDVVRSCTSADSETIHLSETSLKEAVDIESLAAVDYIYKGIAEKAGKFLWNDTVDYRVKYEAHVRASYDMGEIQFTLDEGNMVATAYLPEAQISDPVINENEFGFLPENPAANVRDILAICKEDAANDFNREEIKRGARDSLEGTVEALTEPLLGDKWTIEFKDLSEYPNKEEVQNEGE
ncbi:DUF4230 domain-containing protein [Eggerthellaceae bacterium zg-887]|uniref:DUF4230 domain-containing protein n=1 Tax=Xiamenia xianingshaonis TaxID=2682776 RepID=UPI001407E5D4|nr:DUF4230 domain-containing protein [Xiamenia xianingshaonis]NHM16471.1 DUF4230 domain-containing protein [Xiamenia xianingshaonis]